MVEYVRYSPTGHTQLISSSSLDQIRGTRAYRYQVGAVFHPYRVGWSVGLSFRRYILLPCKYTKQTPGFSTGSAMSHAAGHKLYS